MNSFTHDLIGKHCGCMTDRTQFEEVPQGWQTLVSDLVDGIATILSTTPGWRMTVLQIKDKFGELRFYFQLDPGLDPTAPAAVTLATLVQDAKHRSTIICSVCGEPGMRRQLPPRTIETRCASHARPLSRPV